MKRGMRGVGRSLVFGVALVGALALAAPALAATQTMNVETSSGAWSFAGNWNNGAGPAPSNGDDVILAQGGAENTIYDLDPSVQLQSITLQNRATDPWRLFTISGSLYALKSGGSLTDSNSSTGPDQVGGMALNGPTSITLAAGALGLKLVGGISGTGPVTYTNGSSVDDGLVVDHATSYSGATTVSPSTHRVLFNVNGAVPTGSALDVAGVARFSQFSTIGSLKGAGTVLIDAPNVLTVGGDNTDTAWSGAIVGSLAGLTKVGTGTFTISGTGNTYTAPTAVNGGTLLLTGSIDSPVVVNSGATIGGTGSTTSTIPTPAALTVNAGGTVAPGTTGIGTFNTGSASFVSGSTFAPELSSANADQLGVTGTVSLGGATLNLSLLGGYLHTPGTTRTIITNDGSDPVTGTFAGLPQGTTIASGGNQFRISYTGGTGNDVTLTAVASPTATITTPQNGATFSLGQAVSTSFTCADGAGGPGIASCVDQSGHTSGGGLDTSTPGAHTLTVTATSLDSLTATATATYTVTPSAEDPRCQRLRDKLKRQKRGLAKAKTANKRAFVRHNIGQTKTRLRVFNCAAS